MNILMSSGDFLPNVGGVAAVVWELSRALARHGHQVRVAHWIGPDEDLPVTETREGVTFHRTVLRPPVKKLSRLSHLRDVSKALNAMIEEDLPDVIHSHTIHPDGYAVRFTRKGILRVFTNHTSDFVKGFQSPVRRLDYRMLLSAYDGVLNPSEELNQMSVKCGARRSVFISNGVDVSKFTCGQQDKSATRAELGLPLDATILVAARRFTEKNGLRYLAGAFCKVRRKMPEAFLVFCGPDFDHAELAAVKGILESDGGFDRVLFAGAVPNHVMPKWYQAADIAVLPSLIEATSIAGLESMASGLPLVASDVGGIPVIVQDGVTGLLVPPADVNALANALCRLVENKELRMQMGKASRQRVESEFDWSRIAKQTEQAYLSFR